MRRVLVVEDDSTSRALLRSTLRIADCDVTEAVNGTEALQALEEGSFDLVLLDIMLPHRSGYEILEWMQSRGIDVPVVVISATDTPEGLIREARGGAIDHVNKPFGYDEVIGTVERAFALSPEDLRAQRAQLLEAADDYAARLQPETPAQTPDAKPAEQPARRKWKPWGRR